MILIRRAFHPSIEIDPVIEIERALPAFLLT